MSIQLFEWMVGLSVVGFLNLLAFAFNWGVMNARMEILRVELEALRRWKHDQETWKLAVSIALQLKDKN